MKAWRVHDFGEPQDRFVLDEVPEPTAADLAGMSMSLGGWVPGGPGLEPFDDWVIMRMDMAALALPDVTMCRGTYPVPVLRPYVSGQEGVGTVEDAAPSRRDLLGKRVVACTIQPWGSLAPVRGGRLHDLRGAGRDDGRTGRRVPHRLAYGAPRRHSPWRRCLRRDGGRPGRSRRPGLGHRAVVRGPGSSGDRRGGRVGEGRLLPRLGGGAGRPLRG